MEKEKFDYEAIKKEAMILLKASKVLMRSEETFTPIDLEYFYDAHPFALKQ